MQTLNNKNYGATLAQAQQHLANLEPFNTGTLAGSYYSDGTYFVDSYGTTIAWQKFGEAVISDDAYEYSATTSKHTNMVKKAWGVK